MHKQYFYLDKNSFVTPNTIILKKQDANHLVKVWRKKIGDRLYGKTFDSRELEMEIEIIKSSGVQLKIIKESFIQTKNNVEFYCFLSIPKLPTLSALLPKLSQLDVTGCFPIITERSFIQKKTLWNHKRFQRIVNESFKQCGRLAPLNLYEPVLLKDLHQVQTEIGHFKEINLLLPWEGEAKNHILMSKITSYKIGYFIGPEGGLTLSEVELLKGFGFNPVSLGETVLKVENAAITTLIYLKALHFFKANSLSKTQKIN